MRTLLVALAIMLAIMWAAEAQAQDPRDTLPNVRWDDHYIVQDFNGDGWQDIAQIGDTWIGEPARVELVDGELTMAPGTEQWVPEESGVFTLNGYDGTVSLLAPGSYRELRVLDRRLQARTDGLPQRWEDVYILRGEMLPLRIGLGSPNGSDPTYRGVFVWTTSVPVQTMLLACQGFPCEAYLQPKVRVRYADTGYLAMERWLALDDPRLEVVGQTWTYTPTLWTPNWSGYGLQWDVCLGEVCASDPGPGIESGSWFGMFVQ